MNAPYFSVVVTVYNKEEFIGMTLKHILAQTFKDFELIVVNDGSTDGSLKEIGRFSDPRLNIFTISNSGVSAARNYGMEKAKGKYLALSDGDDIWKPNHLTELKRLIDAFSLCGAYVMGYEKHFFNLYVVKPKFVDIKFPFFGMIKDYFKSSTIDDILWTSAVAIPRRLVENNYRFDESIGCGEDIDLWIRIAKEHNIAFSSEVTAQKMIYAEDNHLSLRKNITELMYIFNKHSEDEANNPSLKSYLDINRFTAAMEAKIRSDYRNYRSLRNQIQIKNLNYKLRILLNLPSWTLRLLKKIKFYLLRKRLYVSPFRF